MYQVPSIVSKPAPFGPLTIPSSLWIHPFHPPFQKCEFGRPFAVCAKTAASWSVENACTWLANETPGTNNAKDFPRQPRPLNLFLPPRCRLIHQQPHSQPPPTNHPFFNPSFNPSFNHLVHFIVYRCLGSERILWWTWQGNQVGLVSQSLALFVQLVKKHVDLTSHCFKLIVKCFNFFLYLCWHIVTHY